jgi:hypothetical protein
MSSVDDLASLIAAELQSYSDDVTEKVKKAVDIVADEVNEEIKKRIPFNQRTGKYVKAFRLKTSYEDKFNKRNTWYVANGQHRLTHLLENGHAKRNGGRVKEFPHIKYGEDLAEKRMVELAEEAVKG